MSNQRSRPTPTTEDARSVLIGTMQELFRARYAGHDEGPESAYKRLLHNLAAAHLTIVSEVPSELEMRPAPPAALSVDVEKLRELVTKFEHRAARTMGDSSGVYRYAAEELAALLDSTPSVTPGHPVKAGAGYDCGCGECLHRRAAPSVDYGVDVEMLREQLDSRIRLLHNATPDEQQTGKEALASFRQWLDLVATGRWVGVPVDGAPEEALCDCRHIGSDHNDEGLGLVPCQRCDCPDYSPVDGAPGEDSQR